MKKWFCKSEGLDATTKIAVYTAGYCVAKNNQKILAAVLPVALGIQETVDNGADNEIMNAILKDAIASLVERPSGRGATQAAGTRASSEKPPKCFTPRS